MARSKSLNASREEAFARNTFCIESFGVRVRIESNDPETLLSCRNIVREALAGCFRVIPDLSDFDHSLRIKLNPSGRDSLYKDGRVSVQAPRKTIMMMLPSRIKLTVAEFAPRHVFIHAGVVAWQGRALIIPGSSMQGKTSLVIELIKRGATYYSDEYAILDENALVIPFPLMLSVRKEGAGSRPVEFTAKSFGSATGKVSIPARAVLFTRYVPNAKWRPRKKSSAQGTIAMLQNAVSIRTNPAFVLSVLERLAKSTLFVETDRGEASLFADQILELLDHKHQRKAQVKMEKPSTT